MTEAETLVFKFNSICRTCLSEGELLSLFLVEGSIKLSDMLMACASVQITEDDGFPPYICIDCTNKTKQAYLFRQQCEKSDVMLRSTVYLESEKEPTSGDVLQNDSLIEAVAKSTTIFNDNSSNENIFYDSENDLGEFDEHINNGNCDKNQNNDLEEPVRKKVKDSESLRKKHTNIQNVSSKFTCRKCKVKFQTRLELSEHIKNVKHPAIKDHVCNICLKPITRRHLKEHIRTHTKEKPYTCEICGQQFSLNYNLRRHAMRHTGERPYRCQFCNKGFIQARAMEDHARVHTGETPYYCSLCGKLFATSMQLGKHRKTHNKENQVTVKKRVSWGSKRKSQASDERPFTCDICHKGYTTQMGLKTHLFTHGDKKFLCSFCGKGFVTKQQLQLHTRCHTGEKPYRCEICNKSFSRMNSLKSHLVVHSSEKKFPCPICGKEFIRSITLKTHMLIHTGQKPFKCQLCDKSFTQSSHLKTHLRTHNGEKPYVCTVCNKQFAQNTNLTVHLRIHTGETPYLCPICGKGFYDSSSMKKHHKGHTV